MTARRGFALVVTVLMVAAFAIIAAGVMAVGSREATLAGAALRIERARAAAEAGALAVVRDWSTLRYAALHPHADTAFDLQPMDGVHRHVTVRRLAGDLYLVDVAAAVGRHGHHSALRRAALLVRAFDLDTLATPFPAPVSALEVARVEDGQVSAHGPCPHGGPAGPAIVAPAVLIRPGATVIGAPPARHESPPDVPRPDPFGAGATPLADWSLDPGTGTPRAATDPLGCVPGPWNWGATAPGDPCHDLRPFIAAVGPLRVAGGMGRGLLFVQGDADLDGTAFHGVIVATGRLRLAGGASVRGAVRAGEVVVEDASVTGAPCEVRAALAAGGLDRAYRPGDRWWVPVF